MKKFVNKSEVTKKKEGYCQKCNCMKNNIININVEMIEDVTEIRNNITILACEKCLKESKDLGKLNNQLHCYRICECEYHIIYDNSLGR